MTASSQKKDIGVKKLKHEPQMFWGRHDVNWGEDQASNLRTTGQTLDPWAIADGISMNVINILSLIRRVYYRVGPPFVAVTASTPLVRFHIVSSRSVFLIFYCEHPYDRRRWISYSGTPAQSWEGPLTYFRRWERRESKPNYHPWRTTPTPCVSVSRRNIKGLSSLLLSDSTIKATPSEPNT